MLEEFVKAGGGATPSPKEDKTIFEKMKDKFTGDRKDEEPKNGTA